MNRKSVLTILTLLMALLIGVTGAGAAGKQTIITPTASGQVSGGPTNPLTAVSSGFTYQGRLTSSGSAANGLFDFTFTLWDASTGGTQVGVLVGSSNLAVNNGLFTVNLDFGAAAFQGSARWLEMAVRPAGVGAYTTLTPRQTLSPAPYATSLMPGATITGTLTGPMLALTNSGSGPAVQGLSATGVGGYFTSTSYIAVRGDNNSNFNPTIYGVNSGSGPSVMGQGTSGTAVYGLATTGYGVSGISTSSYGVSGSSTSGTGVSGYSSGGYGMQGTSASSIGVVGTSTNSTGVYGGSTSGYGIFGHSDSFYGVAGSSNSNYGIQGVSTDSYGVHGHSTNSIGVYGSTTSLAGNAAGVYGESTALNGNGVIGEASSGTGSYGVWGKNTGAGYAGYFSGNVLVTGNLIKSAGSFKIDDPLDPANKYLSHSFVESPDMMNIYNGEVTLDSKGEATVTMPAWFQVLNQDFRYQLTAVGAPGPNLYIAQKIAGNSKTDSSFQIAGGSQGMEVSWQVTGIRHDAYADAHRIPVEQDKPANEKGYYLHPELFGQPDSKAMENSRPNAQNAPTSVPGIK